MYEKAIILSRSIESDLITIEQIYQAIGTPQLTATTGEEQLIVLAYRLHNLYTAFENIFQRIAVTFENHVSDESRWHVQLLQRMALDLTPIRPAVIDTAISEQLDELRRFRHLFRSAYGIRLDSRHLQIVVDAALALQPLYLIALKRFLTFLESLEQSS
ncbi:MAG: hypothetical protein KA314_22340 [Chloroflexi bacterium]|nr:hypothetical protein [Chloroflexota bacterium]MBP8058582.1 hypothetical protein [Chloroflexota bacterium]